VEIVISSCQWCCDGYGTGNGLTESSYGGSGLMLLCVMKGQFVVVTEWDGRQGCGFRCWLIGVVEAELMDWSVGSYYVD